MCNIRSIMTMIAYLENAVICHEFKRRGLHITYWLISREDYTLAFYKSIIHIDFWQLYSTLHV